jgi:hypothetical protein
MDKLSHEYIQTVAFRFSIDREELLIRKCREYYGSFKEGALRDLANDMESSCMEHIKLLKDKMVKLNIKMNV